MKVIQPVNILNRIVKLAADDKWNGQTLEVWMIDALKAGQDDEVTTVMRNLPEHKRAHYRALWLRIKNEIGKKE